MKFHLSTAAGNVFTGHGADFVRLGVVEYRDNIAVTPERIIEGWTAGGFDTLSEADFAALLELGPEVVLFGTGSNFRFPHPRLTRALTDAGIGVVKPKRSST